MLRFAALVCVFAVFVSHCYALPPTVPARPGQETPTDNSTATGQLPPVPVNDTSTGTSGEDDQDVEESTCPGCCERKGCNITNKIDHVNALGFRRNDMSDWKSCSLPHFPQAK